MGIGDLVLEVEDKEGGIGCSLKLGYSIVKDPQLCHASNKES